MPNIIPLEKVKEKLPKFVKIVEETYKGIRYPAEFIDLDYNEKFTTNVCSVIKLQHGCKSRSNKLRSETNLGMSKEKIPIDKIKQGLPDYLEIDESSYKGARYKARFFDKEYKVWFEAYVGNVTRDGKAYCSERKRVEFIKSVAIPIEEIKRRIFSIYGDELTLIEESYKDTNSPAKFKKKDGKIIKHDMVRILAGRTNQNQLEKEWRYKILVRDNFTCQRCFCKENLCAHHIESWTLNKDKRFDKSNGITFCRPCHDGFHSKYGKGKIYPHQTEEWINSKNFIDFSI